MDHARIRCRSLLAVAIAAGHCRPASHCRLAHAQTIIDDWNQAKLPAPPQLKPVTLVPKETALLVMDFTVQTCTPEHRKRCADSVPKVKKFVEDGARQGCADHLQRRGAGLGAERCAQGAGARCWRTGAAAARSRQIHQQRSGKDAQGQRHQDRRGDGHAGANVGAAYRRRGGVARLQGRSCRSMPCRRTICFPNFTRRGTSPTAARISNQMTLTRLDMIGF